MAKIGSAKISTAFMVVLFWTGLAGGPAGAANGQSLRNPGPAPVVSSAVLMAEAEATDRWLAEMAAQNAAARSAVVAH